MNKDYCPMCDGLIKLESSGNHLCPKCGEEILVCLVTRSLEYNHIFLGSKVWFIKEHNRGCKVTSGKIDDISNADDRVYIKSDVCDFQDVYATREEAINHCNKLNRKEIDTWETHIDNINKKIETYRKYINKIKSYLEE